MKVDASPLATGLLIRAALENDAIRSVVEDRIEYLRLDTQWLERLSHRYVQYWRLTVAENNYSPTEPVAEEAVKFIAWLLNPLSGSDISAELSTRVFTDTQNVVAGHCGLATVPPAERLTVTAAVVGRPVPIIDRDFPVWLPGGLVEPNVELAYEGFVEHVANAPRGDWPEMHRTALLWRLGGIAEGLTGGQGHLSMSLGQLNAQVGNSLPLSMRTATSDEWKSRFVAHRNVFTHVNSEQGITFRESLSEIQEPDDLWNYLRLATLYVAVTINSVIAGMHEAEVERWASRTEQDFYWVMDLVS